MSYIGIDVGTSSVKVLLVNEQGEILDSISKHYPVAYPQVGWSEQNPLDWWEQTKLALADITASHHIEIKGISFSGQMHSLVLLDEQDEIIRPAILWNDGRTEIECQEIMAYEAGRVKALTGNIAMLGFTGPKLKWLEKHEVDNFKRIRKIMLPKDYIAYQLSGSFATDVSDASGTLYFDVLNRQYSQEMLNYFNINEEMLPKVHESYEVIGCIKPNLAAELNLSPTCQIIIGGGDQATGAIGTGTIQNGDCSISLGTSGVVFVAKDEFSSNPEACLHSFAHASGKYHLMGVMLSAAGSLSWMMEQILESSDYDKAMNLIKEASIDEQLLFLPYLMGERTPINDPNARASFIGMNLTHHKKDLLRAVVEGICFGLKDSLELIKQTGTHIDASKVIGGGAKSDVWLQLLADILNIRIDCIEVSEGGAYGAAILAMVGTQAYDSVEEACTKLIKTTQSYEPIDSNVEIYERKYARYQKIYEAVKNI